MEEHNVDVIFEPEAFTIQLITQDHERIYPLLKFSGEYVSMPGIKSELKLVFNSEEDLKSLAQLINDRHKALYED